MSEIEFDDVSQDDIVNLAIDPVTKKLIWCKRIEVYQAENDEDWQFVFLDMGDGIKSMAVF